jgi:hypothetical protein
MFTQAELIDAITELECGKHSIQNCEKLAAIYTVLDHLYEPHYNTGYSNKSGDEMNTEIGLYGKSEFLKTIAGKPTRETWLLIDELVEAIGVLNPRLLSNFLDRLKAL